MDRPVASAGAEEGGSDEKARNLGNSATVILEFANGCTATLLANQPAYKITPRTRETELYGTHGRIRIRLGEGLDVTTNDAAYEVRVSRDDPFTTQARRFTDAIVTHSAPPIGGADAVKVLEVIEAIRVSSAERRIVHIMS